VPFSVIVEQKLGREKPPLSLLIDCHEVIPLARLNSTATIAVATGNVRHHNARETIVTVMIPNLPTFFSHSVVMTDKRLTLFNCFESRPHEPIQKSI